MRTAQAVEVPVLVRPRLGGSDAGEEPTRGTVEHRGGLVEAALSLGLRDRGCCRVESGRTGIARPIADRLLSSRAIST